jgi:thiopeptide-type bacteriocin biosynthesis protein
MWESFYIFAAWPAEQLLIDVLQTVEQERVAGRIKRYFLIRYSEGGYHFRLRLQKPAAAAIDALLATCEERARVDRSEPYSRDRHYFGESPLSVYSELLNTHSSVLTLAGIADPRFRPFHARLSMAALYTAQIMTCFQQAGGNALALIQAGIDFAGKQIRSSEPESDPPAPPEDSLQRIFNAAQNACRMRGPCHASIRSSARLLIRLARHNGGIGVAAHSLHLLHNKLGLGFRDEWITMTLAAICFGSASVATPQGDTQ